VNFCLYRLTWDAEKQKFQKKPTALDGSPLLKEAGIPTASREVCEAAVQRLGPAFYDHQWHDGYAVGRWFNVADQAAFIDLDDAIDTATNTLRPEAYHMVAPLLAAGAFFEPSSSGRGAHVVCRYQGTLPPHANRRPAVHDHEFYVRDRGMVLHPELHQGSWDVDCTAQVVALVQEWFPPRDNGKELFDLMDEGPRPNWRGPTDDDALLHKALTATGSAAARMGGKLTFAQLWAGECEHNSEADMALAAHLAFWTGCDGDRIERLMMRSGLRRAKWFEHRTYLRKKTINRVCSTTANVYQEPVRVDVAARMLGPRMPTPAVVMPQAAVVVGPAPASVVTDWHQLTDSLIQGINNAGTYRELTDTIMPGLGTYGLPRVHAERVVSTLHKKLDLFDAKLPLAELRRLVSPPIDMTQPGEAQAAPAWMASICYITSSDKFFDYTSGTHYSHEAFRMQFARLMPMKSNGQREDPVQWARERWNVPTVSGSLSRPDQEPVFFHAGHQFVNTFRPNTLPANTEASDEAKACITMFQEHLAHIVNGREHLYRSLLMWIAHNVQKPGRKIRWTPLIKGVGGDGKSIIGELLFCTMGDANVKMTTPATLSNSGGFTDWAVGASVNVIEEIRLEGKEKRKLYNAMKVFIGDTRIELNSKGARSGIFGGLNITFLVNVMNHLALTNYGDALPMDNDDRRYCIIFTPWENAAACAAIKGLPAVAGSLPSYFKRLGDSMRREPGAWAAWLRSIDLSSFDPDSRAPESDEREAMMSSSSDYIEQTVQDCIERGGQGITSEAFDSSSLMGHVHTTMGEKPDARSWNRILIDLGWRQFSTPIWWNGKTRRVWTKIAMSKEKIVEILNRTVV
jgi:hypothetical protein